MKMATSEEDNEDYVKFELPKQLLSNNGGWGPPAGGDKNLGIFDRVFQPFAVRDPVDVVANWYLYSNDRVAKTVEAGVANNTEDVGPSVQQLEREFAIVSDIKKEKAQWQRMRNARVYNKRQREVQRERRKLRASTNIVRGTRTFGDNTQRKRSKWHRNRNAMSKYRQKQWQNRQILQEGAHDTSCKVNHDTWKLRKEWEYPDLSKYKAKVDVPEPVERTGVLLSFNKQFEKITTNSRISLKKYPNHRFFNVSADNDPIIQSFMGKNAADVYITDSLLAVLMTVPRSAYSWDIVVTKKTVVVDGNDQSSLAFIQRPKSQIEMLSVDETHAEQTVVPTNDNMEIRRAGQTIENINCRSILAQETTLVNQRFQLQCLSQKQPSLKWKPSPFASAVQGAEKVAPTGYAYRIYELPMYNQDTKLKVMVRNQYNAHVNNQPIQVHTFSQYDSRTQRAKNWQKDLDRSKGSIVMDEQRNNSAKVARWCAAALISDVPCVKMGFVGRSEVKDNKKHKVLGMTSYTPQAFARELRLVPSAMWGSFGTICSFIMSQEDGKYVILKEPPPKKSLKIFKVPEHEFEDEYLHD